MLHVHARLRRNPLVNGAPQGAEGTIPRPSADETSDRHVSRVNNAVAVFLASVVLMLVVYADARGAAESGAAVAALLLAECSYVRYRRVRTH